MRDGFTPVQRRDGTLCVYNRIRFDGRELTTECDPEETRSGNDDAFVHALRQLRRLDALPSGLDLVAEAPWSVAEWAVAPRFDMPRATVLVLLLG